MFAHIYIYMYVYIYIYSRNLQHGGRLTSPKYLPFVRSRDIRAKTAPSGPAGARQKSIWPL